MELFMEMTNEMKVLKKVFSESTDLQSWILHLNLKTVETHRIECHSDEITNKLHSNIAEKIKDGVTNSQLTAKREIPNAISNLNSLTNY